MSLNNADVWADLRYALDELERTPLDIHGRLKDAANLYEQPEDEFSKRLLQIALLSIAYSNAKARSDARNAHEAIEKGLKAILIDGGLSEKQVRSRGHQLHQLLEDVQQHNPTAFNELKRCFDSTIQLLESVTPLRHSTNILDYFREHGKSEIFIANRYASIEGANNTPGGMIGFIYREMIRALMSLIFGGVPKDVIQRIEREASKAVLTESKLDPAWDATEWLKRGSVRPRLEVIENLKNNRVLRAAVRRCARESKDSSIQYWAKMLRHNQVTARRKTRAAQRVG
ncbi:MAG: HEPN domain-containing protein [Gammaproteobacteria bacterium]|nr:HEPN domain-containing protein [Gammaproteobacteria bacterium]MYF66242.1 HEPN domain-containing protein [Gammaproteobacteria bacterium]MYK38249.1 HEPN domain-containing protein [Gammaproteobacteria bacterium]